MNQQQLLERVRRIADVRADTAATKQMVTAGLVDVEQIVAWAEAQRAGLITRLTAIDSFPEAAIAETSRCSVNQAAKSKERADTLTSMPGLSDSLAGGRVTTGHIDAATRATKNVDSDRRDELLGRIEQLVGVAEHATIAEFDRRLKLEVKQMESDDGESRFERQLAAVRLRTWTDGDGMWNLLAKFDPATALALSGKLDSAVQTLFAEATPEHCPDDPVEKNKFLAAHALTRLLDGGSSETAPGDLRGRATHNRVDCLVVIDADAPDQAGPVAEFAIPVEVPLRVLASLVDGANTRTVVIRNGVVLHAPGNLNLGRSTRLANRAQRRALRSLYSCCAIPGCAVPFDRLKIHHVIWWRDGGTTDLGNLLPVCSKHHGKIHHDGWVVTLGPRRQLTLSLPDGAVKNTGPPSIRAA